MKNPLFYVILLIIGEYMEVKERESNIELLRIFSMFLIVLFHLGYHGIILSNGINISIPKIIPSMLNDVNALTKSLIVLIIIPFIE